MTYEEAKKIRDMLARAEELAQAVKDGKIVEYRRNKEQWCASDNHKVEGFFNDMQRLEYRITKPKTRRPWTKEEAEAHLGWVLVAPDGSKCLMTHTHGREKYAAEGWQVHPVGHPNQLKPAYVEE